MIYPIKGWALRFWGARRHKIDVYVWRNQIEMREAAKRLGAKLTFATRACFLYSSNTRASLHFTKRNLGVEVLAHESCHGAQWLVRTAKSIMKHSDPIEMEAFWTGQIAKALVFRFREAGFYGDECNANDKAR